MRPVGVAPGETRVDRGKRRRCSVGVRRMSLPIVVTHPSTLFHSGLRQLFAKSQFRPVRIATVLNKELENYLKSQGSCVWLTGVEISVADTNALVQKVV